MSETSKKVAKEVKPGQENMYKRSDLLAAVTEKTGLPRPRALAVIEAVFEELAAAFVAGKEVRLANFGVFAVAERKAGKGRDPRTGAEIDVPASKSVRFRQAKNVKDSLNA